MRPARFEIARCALLALPVLLVASIAHADEPCVTTPAAPSAPATTDSYFLSHAQTTYFLGEKAQGYGWGGVGIVGMGAGAVLYKDDHPFTRGASYPIFFVGVAQTVIAALSFVRPDGRIARNDESIAKDPAAWLAEERARIHTVNRFLTGVKILEVATVVTGIALTSAGLLNRDQSMEGVGFGISAQGVAMFVLDAFAHERAEKYERVLTLEPPAPR